MISDSTYAFQQRLPTSVYITEKIQMQPSDFHALDENETRKYIFKLVKFTQAFYKTCCGIEECAVHDATAVMAQIYWPCGSFCGCQDKRRTDQGNDSTICKNRGFANSAHAQCANVQ